MLLRPIFVLLAPLLLSGCFLKVRELRTENRMLQARVDQLTQDLEATQAAAPPAEAKVADATRQIQEKDAAISHLRMKVDSLQTQLNESQEKPLATRTTAPTEGDNLESYAALQKQVEDNATRASEKELEIAELNMRIHDLEAKNNDLRTEVSRAGETASEGERAVRQELERSRQAATESETRAAESTERSKAAEERATSAEAERDALRQEAAQLLAKAQAATTDSGMPEAGRLARINQATRESLSTYVKSGEATVRSTDRAVVVSIQVDALFQPASTTISDSGLKILQFLKDPISASGAPSIRIIGHTDNQPLGKRLAMYTDNWDLAAARANAIVRWLVTQPGMKQEQFSSVSRSYVEPLASNDDANGRRRNRRVEVWIEWTPPTKPTE